MTIDRSALQILAEANPIPMAAVADLDLGDTPSIHAIQSREVIMTQNITLKRTTESTTQNGKRQWRRLLAAAALLIVIIGLSWLALRDGSGDVIEQEPAPLPSSPTGFGESYIAALNSRDAELVTRLFVAGTIDDGDGVALADYSAHLEWYEISQWQFNDVQCSEGPSGLEFRVECSATVENRLSVLHGAEPFGYTLLLRVGDLGIIEIVDAALDTSSYSQAAFEPFMVWAQDNSPGDFQLMNGDGEFKERNDAWRRQLDAYAALTELPGNPPWLIADALTQLDPSVMADILDDDPAITAGWISDASEVDGLFAFLAATGWVFDVNECGVLGSNEELPVLFGCHIGVTHGWLIEAPRFPPTVEPRLTKAEDGYTELKLDLEGALVPVVMDPWFEWLEQNHPGDLAVLYPNGDRVPSFESDAVALFAERLAGYRAASGG